MGYGDCGVSLDGEIFCDEAGTVEVSTGEGRDEDLGVFLLLRFLSIVIAVISRF